MSLVVITTGPDYYASYGDPETLSVPSTGPYELETEYLDGQGLFVRVFISGGLLTALSFMQFGQSTYILLGTVPPYIDLSPGDKIKLTYTALTPPVVKWIPR